jgi:hypothetical protein
MFNGLMDIHLNFSACCGMLLSRGNVIVVALNVGSNVDMVDLRRMW